MIAQANGFNLTTYLEKNRAKVDVALAEYLDGQEKRTRLLRAMSYSVMAGGKRLRPILCIASAEAVGGEINTVLPIACALEMIHTYSLIHDDLPAMDDDALRRGAATCHVQFDEATAILAGDALLTLAFEILANCAGRSPGVRNKTLLRIIGRIAAAAGYRGMIEGQMRDMAVEGVAILQKDLERLHRRKTGRMIEVSVESGAMAAGGTDEQKKALFTYAENIGLAFQVVDDILNVKGDPKLLGKAVGTDQLRKKNTYPSIMGLGNAERMAGHLVNNALMALDDFGNKAEPLRAIGRYVRERKR
jgi:geranylgeranyl diphosphate synthase type II